MSNWIEVCELEDIHPNTGVCALANNQQVAIFRFKNTDQIYAVSNFDPIGQANVLSRGLLAQLGDALTIASPLYKQHFDLKTGQCLEQDDISIPVFAAKVDAGKVFIEAV